jgi:hypothetical protein
MAYIELPGSGAVDKKGVRTYHRKFLILDAPYTLYPNEVWVTYLPVTRYSSHPSDVGAIALELSCEPHGEQMGFWDVDITYSSSPFDEGDSKQDPSESDQSTSPPDRPWQITFGSVKSERLLGPKDLDNTPVVNSAGEPFDPVPMIPCDNLLIEVKAYKDFDTFDPISKKKTYQNSINDADLLLLLTPATTTVFDARTVRCLEYNCVSQKEDGQYFWEVTIQLEVRPDKAWNPYEIINVGTLYVPDPSKPPTPILDSHGHPITKAIPISKPDGDGKVMPLNAGDTPKYLSFTAYREANFAAILT